MDARRGLRSRLLAAGVGFAVAFGAGELTFRLVRPDLEVEVRSGRNPMAKWAQVDAFAAYRGIPGQYLSHQKTVNADGFFSTPPLEREKREGVLRVAFLGGSSTAGTVPYLADRETWPWQVAERLRAAWPGREIEFLNAALPGYSTFESYGRLWSRVRFFAPDLVVVYHGWNDMYYFRNPAHAARWRVNPGGGWGFETEERVVEIPGRRVPAWLGWSSALSFAYRAVTPDGPAVGEVGRLGPKAEARLAADFDPAGVAVFRQNLELMRAAEDVLGFRLFVCKQATLIVPGLGEELRAACAYQLHGFDHDAHLRAYEAVYAAVDAVMPAERIVDLRHLSGDPENLVDHVHLTATGARRVAERVAERLIESVDVSTRSIPQQLGRRKG
jgi:lysophospholipase L1-like esterase